MSVLYTRAPRLFADLTIADGMSVAFATPSANDCYLRTAVIHCVVLGHLTQRGIGPTLKQTPTAA